MFCTKCGNQLPENSKFCKYCGNPVRRNQSLLERARNQEEDALAEIYNQSSSAVYRVIKVLVKDEDTVYDILQDTYVKAFTRLDQLQDESKLVPWLKMIANNTAKDWLKKCKPVLFTDMSGDNESDDLSFEESIEDERTDLNPEMAMDEKEVRRLVLEILDQLPEDQRLVIGMFYYEEMSVKDIAFTLGVSDNTVKSRLSYGRKKVKERHKTLHSCTIYILPVSAAQTGKCTGRSGGNGCFTECYGCLYRTGTVSRFLEYDRYRSPGRCKGGRSSW